MISRIWVMPCIVLAMSLLAAGANGQVIQSTRFKDVITSAGIGDIDLFKAGVQSRNLSAANLEAFRVTNGNTLVFAIDVNEAASGFEKSSSQGVAVDTARVVIELPSGTFTFDEFSTQTQSLIARDAELTRTTYYTLIGDGGSGRITSSTSSDINGSSFDATLRIPVDIDISSATAARLEIVLLDTNKSLGDPESFYDYSNGFEDVAIVTAGDAQYLDELAPGRQEAPLVIVVNAPDTEPSSEIYYPSQNDFYIVAYEDQYPNRGDYDFNDLTVAYRVSVSLDDTGRAVGIGGEGYLIARGGGFNHDWHLRIALPDYASGSGSMTVFLPDSLEVAPGYPAQVGFVGALDIAPFERTRELWVDGQEAFVNTLRNQTLLRGHRFSFSVALTGSLMPAELPASPYDPYLFVYNTDLEIHLPGKAPVLAYSSNAAQGLTSFRDAAGYPYAMILPQDWLTPIEFIDLGEAYPEFLEFVTSGGQNRQDWYRTPSQNAIKQLNPSHWKW